MTSSSEQDAREKLIKRVKKEVKKIMEEAVTRKFVHEESSSVTSLCGAVEACLSQGLRRRALGLFKTSSTTALLHKVAKYFEPAAVISKKVEEIENTDTKRPSSSSGDSIVRLPAKCPSKISTCASPTPRYLWIRLALFEKQLAKIIDYLVKNSSKYYERNSLVADPDYGSILSSLLVGPCALDYSKTKTQDHFLTDPPADELVQRNRISSGHTTPPSCRRPVVGFTRSLQAVSSEEGNRVVPLSAKDYVESLHQNNRATLLYGKNNVLVLPKDLNEPIPGYLSLHQTTRSLTIKWTPNQLMNGYIECEVQDKSSFWDYALNMTVEEVVYVHCHQKADSGGTIVLVGQDGIQHPPIHFPRGGHLLAFLSCLENGLLPHGQLDPPLWSQRGKGKVFPKIRRKGRVLPAEQLEELTEESTDYVFRIINKTCHEDFLSGHELLDPTWTSSQTNHKQVGHCRRLRLTSNSTSSSTSSTKSFNHEFPECPWLASEKTTRASGYTIQLVCDSMKRQIISRAFYGWLAYCRHLCTVRKHLSGLVNKNIISINEPVDASDGLTKSKWEALHVNGKVIDRSEVFRLTYYGGVNSEIRKEVWPYLLGYYDFESSEEARRELDRNLRKNYETTMSEWLAVEAIVRQKDKETMAANLAKLSSESTSGEAIPPMTTLNHDLSNDVFEDNFSSASDDSKTNVNEEEQKNYFCNDADNEHSADIPSGKDTVSETTEKNESDSHEGFEKNHITCEDSKNNETDHIMENHHSKMHECDVNCNENPKKDLQAGSIDEGVIDDVEPPLLECKPATYVPDHSNEPDKLSAESKQVSCTSTVIVRTNPSVDSGHQSDPYSDDTADRLSTQCEESDDLNKLTVAEVLAEGNSQCSRSTCISPASSQGGIYSVELLDTFGLNLHRIDKDVQRCDRNYWYFTNENLEKLRNIMCTYVWEHLDNGYMQGMCDLVAPLLVILDDEGATYACFCCLMERMGGNFPNGGAMDNQLANMRSLIQILDSEIFELMHQNGDYTHFYFCYRWFLLDFKREFVYEDVFSTWEVIWAAKHVASSHFVLFIALALVETYRDIILSNSMDFTDIIKFFNEMAERHDSTIILKLARDLVLQLQTLIENK
ncbi:small G protein signaling modulator 2-like [Bacillus rossius redtenbacheri]|uniref:small G protein signaling modulator 2-like n=1 Tax=Bacillus rossius redtenbacheri TaxID=93214 RepID=UPI002FDCDDA6